MLPLSEIGSTLPVLARKVLEEYLSTGKVPSLSDGGGDRPAAPVFVTLHDRAGELRGCIGTLEAKEPDVCEETARCAVLAATRDPRFPPVSRQELDGLSLDVTVLFPLEPIESESQLEPRRYGVVVRDRSGRQGVLLPDLPGVDDVATQLRIARRKAHIDDDAKVTLFRFLAERFTEPGQRS